MAKARNNPPAPRKSRRKLIPTPVAEITPAQLEQALALARSQPDRPQQSVASFDGITGDTWIAHVFRAKLAQSPDILEIKRCAEVLLDVLISTIGLEETRKIWPIMPSPAGGSRDPALDHRLLATYQHLRREHPDWTRIRIMTELARLAELSGKAGTVASVERRIDRLLLDQKGTSEAALDLSGNDPLSSPSPDATGQEAQPNDNPSRRRIQRRRSRDQGPGSG